MEPERAAETLRRCWIARCRARNESGRVELWDVSNWAEKRSEINADCPDLDSMDGIFLLFCFGSLLSFGGGSYQGRTSELRNRYTALISRRYDYDARGEPFSTQRKMMFEAIERRLHDVVQRYGEVHPIQNWWYKKKRQFAGNLERAAEDMLREIHSWTYPWPEGNESPLFTVKTFWIPRELHANGIWPDFPVKYCCVPDSRVRAVLRNLFGLRQFRVLFNIEYNDSSFDLQCAILMSHKVWELISQEAVDSYYPYDLPFFRTENSSDVAQIEAIIESDSEQQVIPTWGRRSSFSYAGSVATGTRITFGRGFVINVTAAQYRRLLSHFNGRRVPCGTSRTEPPRGSLGRWLMENVTKTAIASYVGRILVHEGYARKIGSDIQFNRFTT